MSEIAEPEAEETVKTSDVVVLQIKSRCPGCGIEIDNGGIISQGVSQAFIASSQKMHECIDNGRAKRVFNMHNGMRVVEDLCNSIYGNPEELPLVR